VLFQNLYSAREAAAELGVSRATIARWVAIEHMKPEHVAGNAYVFTAEEVDRVRKARRPHRGRGVRRPRTTAAA
jgi:excisionase family DNA binding protein